MTLRRKEKIRHIRKRVLILCEGSKTEPNYFTGLKNDKSLQNLSGVEIIVAKTKKTTAWELLEEARKLRDEAKKERIQFDDVWVVFDKDNYPKHSETFSRAEAIKINIAFSSPCFEFWYFLHFKHSDSPVANADDMLRKLKEFIPDYEKGGTHYEKLKPHTNIAISNSKKVITNWKKSGTGKIWESNAYTDVGILVEKLLNL